MDNFKSCVHYVRPGAPQPTWDTGVSSELTELPPGFEHRTMLVAGSGITATLDAWGRALRRVHGTNRSFDRGVEFLSYWTGTVVPPSPVSSEWSLSRPLPLADNGAYYSGGAWAPPKGGVGGGTVVNEKALKAVAAGLKKQDLLAAVKIWQLDECVARRSRTLQCCLKGFSWTALCVL